MNTFKKLMFITGIVFSLSSCSYIDDFVFGKDNTPKPHTLPLVNVKIPIVSLWSSDIGVTNKQSSTPDLQPAQSGGRIYVATSTGVLTTLQVKTGAKIWQQKTHLNFLAGPILTQNYVIITADDASVYLFDKTDGHQVKRLSVINDVLSKPLVHHNVLYTKTISGVVTAFDLKTGAKRWSYSHGSPEIILKASSSPVIYKHMLIVGFSDGSLLGLDPDKGTILFQQHLTYPRGASEVERLVDIDTNPLVDGQYAYVASFQGEIGSYSLEQMNFQWHKMASTYHDLAISGHTLLMVSTNDVIWAFDKNNGQVLWKQKGLIARGVSAPVVRKNTLFVADKFGYIHGLDIKTGEFVSQFNLKSRATSAPVINQDVCWVVSANGQLHRLLLRD